MIDILLIGLIFLSLLIALFGLLRNEPVFNWFSALFLLMIGFYMMKLQYDYLIFLIPLILGILLIFYSE